MSVEISTWLWRSNRVVDLLFAGAVGGLIVMLCKVPLAQYGCSWSSIVAGGRLSFSMGGTCVGLLRTISMLHLANVKGERI